MRRLPALFVLATCSVCVGICQAAPGIVAVINGSDYSNSFIVSPIAQGYSITGSISNDFFTFAFDATTDADPSIDYQLSIGGDPTVQLTILQPYLGGPFPLFTGRSNVTITDANHDGRASMLGSPFINTAMVDGVLAGQYDTGCDLTGTPGFTVTCPVSQIQGVASASIRSELVVQKMELEIEFSLSDGDFAPLNGCAALSVPEPATGASMASALVLLSAGFALRSWDRRNVCRVPH
jgi:hypothetical protein